MVSVGSAAPNMPAGGTARQVLAKNSASDYDAGWTAPGAPAFNITQKSANYNPAAVSDFVVMDASGGARSVTLPAVPATNSLIGVRKNDTSVNAVTVLPGAGANIDGSASLILRVSGASATLQYDGTNWRSVNAGTQVPTGGTTGQALVKGSATNYDTVWSTNGQVPTGGAVNQVLSKNTATNYDVGWSSTGLIPAGGSTGQVLSKNTGTNYDAAWTTPVSGGAGSFAPWVTGRYFTAPFYSSAATVGSNLGALGALFYPVYVPNACTIATLNCYMTSGGSGSVFLGLYADNPAAASTGPAAVVAGNNVPVSTTGAYSLTVNYVVAAPTLLWAAFHTTSAASFITFPPTFGFLLHHNLQDQLNRWCLAETSYSATAMPSNASTGNMSPITSLPPMISFGI